MTLGLSSFFWFFESRKDPRNAPLSIWINGGPGTSSLMGLLQENGPCFVNPDSNSTTLNPHSWNNEVNMLYIDQPVQAGYSYDVLRNGTLDLTSGDVVVGIDGFEEALPEQNNTFLVGTFPSQELNRTSNTTVHAAHALWHFAQTWFAEFPVYKPEDDRVNIWTESYGGKYGPTFTAIFEEQNQKVLNGTTNGTYAYRIHLDTLGIVNGCIDGLIQGLSYPEMAFNNTYGIMAINKTVYKDSVNDYWKLGGCRDMILQCRNLTATYDPRDYGGVSVVNTACKGATDYCEQTMAGPYEFISNRGMFDIAHPNHDPFPPPYLQGFLNQHWVQKSLGVPVNHTLSSRAVARSFGSTGDHCRGGQLEDLKFILESGIKVALVYGDRDFICNWIGGEEVSLAVDYTFADNFRKAGYQSIEVNGSYVGGQVRQYGNFSFSRVYQAGHEVPAYQPATSYEIFMRSLSNRDISTGKTDVADDYRTTGPSSTWHIKNIVPDSPEPTCYILAPETCTKDQYASVKNGTALVKDYIVRGGGEDMLINRPGGREQQPVLGDGDTVAF
ncbi:hypothetical protein FGG08_003716 [Glutinoglossum americanum]|uniref:Carboxypeptidase n=1 Tax=Glutinoglossum americanum TaxID=1670608 RepID=A0A9P8IAI5_9PEZI|nr:hypothetical protein FGG08_003716 [Glutinoglossum americanum]